MDNKKYYWLKLKSDFFDTEDLILLETMPDGVIYSNILLKLYLKSYHSKFHLLYMKNPNNPINKMRLINNALNDESGFIKLDIVIYKTITITINHKI